MTSHLRSRFTEKIIGKGRLSRTLRRRRERKQKKIKQEEERKKKFAKEFGSSPPSSFNVKPDLPTRGSKKRRRFLGGKF